MNKCREWAARARVLFFFMILSTGAYSATRAELAGTIHFYDQENQDCLLTATGESGYASVFACDYTPQTMLIEAVPARTSILLSEKDCAEASGGWVKLETTARNTSSEKISLSNIFQVAARWQANPATNPYVSPNVKVVGADTVGSATLRCALLGLPTTQPASFLRTVPLQTQPQKRDQTANCGNGVVYTLFHDRADEFSYQCAQLLNANGQLFKAVNSVDISFKVGDTAAYCPANKVVTSLYLDNSYGGEFYEGGRMTCSEMKTDEGQRLTVSSIREPNRWIHYNQHNSVCENSRFPGPTVLLSASNAFLVGVDVVARESKWYCAHVQSTL